MTNPPEQLTIAIRPADLEGDRKLMVQTLSRSLNPLYDDARFDWAYRANPHGAARAWIAFDRGHDAVIGTAAAFPRRVFAGDREERGWVLGDFCINDPYRTLGPAVQLQRACLAEVDAGTAGFCYDFPSASMTAVYARLGIAPTARMLRFALPLRVDRRVREWVKHPSVARALSGAANLALALRAPRGRGGRSLAVALDRGRCAEEFTALAQEVGGRHGVCISRSAAYLNWRYLDNPLRHHELMTARRDGRLRGYAVFSQLGEDATLVDLFGAEPPSVIDELVRSVIEILRERGAATVSVPLLEGHPWIPRLRRLGFIPRESSPVVIYDAAARAGDGAAGGRGPWFLVYGDLDS
jgi:hypothetical protein